MQKILEKIMRYNIHPVAQQLKFSFEKYDHTEECYEFILENYCSHHCYYCHKKAMYNVCCFNLFKLCEKCFQISDPNDDIYNCTGIEILITNKKWV